MKRALLYILLSMSVCLSLAVSAQQQADQETPAANDNEPSASTEQPVESKPPEESGETDARDEDFKPSEEISEDYPVPLPSDI